MIKMLTPISGERFSVAANKATDRFTDKEEQRLVDRGFAVFVTDVSDQVGASSPAAPVVEMHENDVAPVQVVPVRTPAVTPPPVSSAPATPSKPAQRKARG